MDEPQLPYMGPTKGPCPDGCGRYGHILKNGHVRGCPCRSCLGRRNRTKGLTKQRKARKALDIPGPSLGADHEENWLGVCRHEIKAGAQVGPAARAFYRMEAQSEAARPIGDMRPFVGIAMPDGITDGIVMFRLSKLREVIQLLNVAMGINWEERADDPTTGEAIEVGDARPREIHPDRPTDDAPTVEREEAWRREPEPPQGDAGRELRHPAQPGWHPNVPPEDA